MKSIAIGGVIGALSLSGCVIDAGGDGDWSDKRTSLEERTRLAVEACGSGRVAEVEKNGFTCQGAGKD